MILVEDLAKIAEGSSYVDCYVPTESHEASAYLEELGFSNISTGSEPPRSDPERTLAVAYDNFGVDYLISSQNGLKIDCVDISLGEDLRMRGLLEGLGEQPLPSMSKFRIYTNESHGTERLLGQIADVFSRSWLYLFFVNESATRVYVRNDVYVR